MRKKIKEKSILELTASEAKEFLLQGKSYCSFDLPPYFDFSQLIKDVSNGLGDSKLSDFYFDSLKPDDFEDTNYKLLTNKDGKYSWRQFELIHPALYVGLASEITESNAWSYILDRFKEFQLNSKIQCISIPIKSLEMAPPKKSAIFNWWDNVEQKSIELALEYQYLIQTDITDCYGSIYTHSLAWALHGKEKAKEKQFRNEKKAIGNIVDRYLRSMSYGQTNGIAQGSELMNLVAEIVLGYFDLLLSEKISKKIKEYRIIRYRDDYRIFTNNAEDGEAIIKNISQVLHGLGMKLHPQKTVATSQLVRDSLKADKRYWISHKRKGSNLQKDLLIIHDLAEKYPNSGSLVRALNDFLQRITPIFQVKENVLVLISILIDIAFRNPRVYPVVSAILSKLMDFLQTKEEKISVLEKIQRRFEKVPNIGHLDIWMQRISYKIDPSIKYEEPLCGIVAEKDIQIWNSDWLLDKIKYLINAKFIVNRDALEKMPTIIQQNEVDFFVKDHS